MNKQEFFDALDGLWAYDAGCTDSGIRDERLRTKVIEFLQSVNPIAWLTEFARDLIKEDSPYTIEDVGGFINWLADRMDYRI